MPEKGEMTPLAESSVNLHERFEALVSAGFSDWQALRLLGVMIAELIRSGDND